MSPLNILIFLLFVIAALGCSTQQEVEIPEQLQELENLIVYSSDAEPVKNISFQKDIVYGDSDDLMIGIMGDVVVDSQERVFMADNRMLVIYVFDAGGEVLSTLGGAGQGPGEFIRWVHNMQIHNNYLYALDAAGHRLHMFSLDSLTVEATIPAATNRNHFAELDRALPYIDNLYIQGDGSYIAEFIMNARQQNFVPYGSEEQLVYYFLMDKEGALTTELLSFIREIRSNTKAATHPIKPFFGSVISVFPDNNHIYLVQPDYFLVKTYSPEGEYLRAFYYPISKIPLTKESAVAARVRESFIDLMDLFLDLPEYWPAVTDMKMDDQNRFWIATTIEDMNLREWWVLQETGELITRFEWPRDESIEVVKNGYIYTRETDEETGVQQIVRYQMEIEEV